jgi:hypothetical protein
MRIDWRRFMRSYHLCRRSMGVRAALRGGPMATVSRDARGAPMVQLLRPRLEAEVRRLMAYNERRRLAMLWTPLWIVWLCLW